MYVSVHVFRFVYPLNLPEINERAHTSRRKQETAQSHIIMVEYFSHAMESKGERKMRKEDGIEDKNNIHLTRLKGAFEELCGCFELCCVVSLLLSLCTPSSTLCSLRTFYFWIVLIPSHLIPSQLNSFYILHTTIAIVCVNIQVQHLSHVHVYTRYLALCA